MWQAMHPRRMNTLNPFFSFCVSAARSPETNLSQRDVVTSPRSKAPIASPTFLSDIERSSFGNAARNISTYRGTTDNASTTACSLDIAICTGFVMGGERLRFDVGSAAVPELSNVCRGVEHG